ncbi:type II toxin-antitoxin system HicA family toxin [bacterium]|nr:type II toxin-antitoxin system HicA family toxin [bacterium]
MAVCTYRDFRKVLQKLGFQLARTRKHETWVKKEEGKPLKIVRVRHKRKKDIPKSLFNEMLKQAGIENEEEFQKILNS